MIVYLGIYDQEKKIDVVKDSLVSFVLLRIDKYLFILKVTRWST